MNKSNKSNSAKLIFPIVFNKSKNEIQQNFQKVNNKLSNDFNDENIINQGMIDKLSYIMIKKKHYIKESFEEYSSKINQSLAQYHGVDENKIFKNDKNKPIYKLKIPYLPEKELIKIKLIHKENKKLNKSINGETEKTKIKIKILENESNEPIQNDIKKNIKLVIKKLPKKLLSKNNIKEKKIQREKDNNKETENILEKEIKKENNFPYYKNPLDSLTIIRKNHLIFDEISKSNYERQAESMDEILSKKENIDFKTKMPRLKILPSNSKENYNKISIMQDKNKKEIHELKNLINLIESEEIKEIRFYSFLKYPNKNFPEGREQFSITLKDENELLLFGGITSALNSNCIWKLNLESLEWKKISYNNLYLNPFIRYGHNSFFYNNSFYIYGGKIKYLDSEEFCDFTIFKFNNNKWSNPEVYGKKKPLLRRNFIGELIGNYYIIHGGIIFSGEIISDVYILSLKDKLIWNEAKYNKNNQFKGPSIYAHSSCLVIPNEMKEMEKLNIFELPEYKNSKIKINGIYIFGGKTKDGGLNDELYILILGKSYLEWKKIKTIGKKPLPRCFHSMNYYQKENFIIIHGGRNDIKSESFALNDTFILTLNKMMWIEIKLYNEKSNFNIISRCGHSSCVYDDKLIIFGGMNSNNYIGSSLFIINLNFDYSPKNQNSYIRNKLLNNYRKLQKEDHKVFSRYSYVCNKNQLDILPEYDLPYIK